MIKTQYQFFDFIDTGEQVPNTNPNEIMVIGTLEDGGLFSMQVEGAQQRPTGLQIDSSGTEGVLRISNPLAFQTRTTTPSADLERVFWLKWSKLRATMVQLPRAKAQRTHTGHLL